MRFFQDAYNRLKDELANTKAQYEEFVRQQDEDHDDEMLQVQHHHKKALEEEQEAVLNLKSQASMMRRRFDGFKAEKEGLQSELKGKENELKIANERNEEQERQILMLKNDIRDREQTIDNKEKRISELRLKAKELEKIKFVLDYKYKELKKEMEPKETQILHMKEQIKEMDHELERDVRTNHALGQAHAHINLIGWVSLFLIGLFYERRPQLDKSAGARWQVIIYTIGAVVLNACLAALLLGNTAAEPGAAAGSVVVLGSMFWFAWLVIRNVDARE